MLNPRLAELLALPRVPLPPGVADDDHNRIKGLLDLINEHLTADSVVIESGTGKGVSTEAFALTVGRVITIDPSVDPEWRAAALEVANRYPDKIEFRIDTSQNVSLTIPDGFADAIYIDSDHHYEFTRDEIARWLPKIRKGGIIAGHDYIERPEFGFGVIRAVNEVFGKPDKVYEDTSWVKRL
jgi:predicted O-methyltransferase YrrM